MAGFKTDKNKKYRAALDSRFITDGVCYMDGGDLFCRRKGNRTERIERGVCNA
jgi:hypothetical protein